MENNKIITEARHYIEIKEYSTAISLLFVILKNNPNDFCVLFELGKIYFFLEKYELAEKYLIKTLKNRDLRINSLDFLVKIYTIRKKFNKSIRLSEQILKINNKLYTAHKELVNLCFCDKKDFNKAYKYSKRMLSLFKNDIFARCLMLKSSLYIKKYNYVKKHIDFILKNKHMSSSDTNEIFNLSEELSNSNEYVSAVKLINCIKTENQEEIIERFFKNIQYNLAKFLKNNKNIKSIAEDLLKNIPKKELRIRNIILNELEINNKNIILKSMPRAITVVLTNRCNLKCPMCEVWKNSWDLPEKVIEQIKEIMPYLEYITWHGGEVFLHKDFESLFDYAAKYGVKQEIITNGLLVEKKMMDKFIENDVQLTLSIDGTKKESYEKLRFGGSFEKIEYFLNALKISRKKYGNSKIKIRMNTIISDYNYWELFDFIDFAYKYDFHEIYFFMLGAFDFKFGCDIDKFSKTYKNVVDYFDKSKKTIKYVSKKFGINIVNSIPTVKSFEKVIKNAKFTYQYDKFLSNTTCFADNHKESFIEYDNKNNKQIKKEKIQCAVPWQRLRIDRYVRPHCFCRDDANIGFIDKNFNIFEIWNSKYMQSYRKMIVNNDIQTNCNPACYSGIIPKSQYQGIV